jgi:ERCC4-related helicase
VFEAHRAVKDYAYTLIAKSYVQQSSHNVILAMTASPGSDRDWIKDVCNNLSIEKIEYRNEKDVDVKSISIPSIQLGYGLLFLRSTNILVQVFVPCLKTNFSFL